ncbi:carboxypeptidase-like regulatory domain-containing protein [Hymenobacter sp. BT175]|uniref:carboxypeptidase-like regulatory domain-containing protein n=1 Tax=Hymenobacter translucens TaxID=2886507 RepID=UPI001D0E4C69|nr:carboxypeptidase-like regulatory domain-containing protein [Hymenobacter translucens]MCC2547178.1 carboxypeptidase-like regulatory domain-containing protein [Hymenobacter translucens]
MRSFLSAFHFRLGLLLVLLAIGFSAQAQYKVRGVALDKDTNEPVPFVSIGVQGTTIGTASNANGEFVLNLPSLPQTLIFAEIGHVRDTVRVTSVDQPLTVKMASATIALPEVKVASYAYQLVDRAFRQMQRNYSQKFYGKAFYRQVTRIGNSPTELQEMVWNVKSNNARIEGTSMAQGRFAAVSSLMDFTNFSLYTKSYGLYDERADSTKSLALLSPNVVKNYLVELVGIVEKGQGGVAELSFQTRPELKSRSQGTIWIDIDTYKVMRYQMTSPNFPLSTNNPTFKFKNTQLEVEMVFQDTPKAASPIDYMKVNLTTDLTRPSKPDTKLDVSSFTFFFDTSETPVGATYARVTSTEKDRESINKTKYDPEFWANNPVVKRTPLEDEVIQSFEKKGAFGTMVKPKKAASPGSVRVP